VGYIHQSCSKNACSGPTSSRPRSDHRCSPSRPFSLSGRNTWDGLSGTRHSRCIAPSTGPAGQWRSLGAWICRTTHNTHNAPNESGSSQLFPCPLSVHSVCRARPFLSFFLFFHFSSFAPSIFPVALPRNHGGGGRVWDDLRPGGRKLGHGQVPSKYNHMYIGRLLEQSISMARWGGQSVSAGDESFSCVSGPRMVGYTQYVVTWYPGHTLLDTHIPKDDTQSTPGSTAVGHLSTVPDNKG
jgi:hypothetical protein